METKEYAVKLRKTAEGMTGSWEAKRQEAMDLLLTSGNAVVEREDGTLAVKSGARTYEINIPEGCTCPDAKHRSKYCKHYVALEMHLRASGKPTLQERMAGEGHEMPKNDDGQQELGAPIPEPDDIPEPEIQWEETVVVDRSVKNNITEREEEVMESNTDVAVVPVVPARYLPGEVPADIPAPISAQVRETLPRLVELLPSDIQLSRFQAGLWLQFTSVPKLRDCSPKSIVQATVKAAIKGLLPGRDCCILPFKGQATMVEEYAGLLRRLDRTGRVAWAKAEPVYERDHFVCDELAEVYEFRRCFTNRGELVCFFAAIKLTNSSVPIVRVSTLDEVEKVRRNAPGGEQDAWQKWYEEMGRKTALKKLAKYVQLVDDHEDNGDIGYVDDERHGQNVIDLFGETPAPAAGPASNEQLATARNLLENQGFKREKITERLARVKTSQEASELIEKLRTSPAKK